ncbi:MAG: hypothetical protein M0P69_13920, partial [Bacteroidales bacterium]|nr:hypothetical protein [Bacteroidales bacterium]
ALADDLKFAQDINGTTDPALRGIKRLVISGIRRELLTHERIAEAVALAVAAQAAKCSSVFSSYTAKEVTDIRATNQDIKKQIFNALVENMRILIITIGLVTALLGISAIVTRQITETGTFIETASKVIKQQK